MTRAELDVFSRRHHASTAIGDDTLAITLEEWLAHGYGAEPRPADELDEQLCLWCGNRAAYCAAAGCES